MPDLSPTNPRFLDKYKDELNEMTELVEGTADMGYVLDKLGTTWLNPPRSSLFSFCNLPERSCGATTSGCVTMICHEDYHVCFDGLEVPELTEKVASLTGVPNSFTEESFIEMPGYVDDPKGSVIKALTIVTHAQAYLDEVYFNRNNQNG